MPPITCSQPGSLSQVTKICHWAPVSSAAPLQPDQRKVPPLPGQPCFYQAGSVPIRSALFTPGWLCSQQTSLVHTRLWSAPAFPASSLAQVRMSGSSALPKLAMGVRSAVSGLFIQPVPQSMPYNCSSLTLADGSLLYGAPRRCATSPLSL